MVTFSDFMVLGPTIRLGDVTILLVHTRRGSPPDNHHDDDIADGNQNGGDNKYCYGHQC